MSDHTELREDEREEPIHGAPPAKSSSSGLKEGETEVPISRGDSGGNNGGTAESSGHPENYGFTWANMLGNAKEHLAGFGRGLVTMGQDVLSNPDWVVGQGDTLKEKILDPNTTFNKFVGMPAAAEEKKAKDEWAQGHKIQAAGHELASYIPLVGPWAANLGEQAGTGDVGGALAGGLTDVATAKALPKVAGKAAEEVTAIPKVWRGLKAVGGVGKEAPPAPPPPVATPPIRSSGGIPNVRGTLRPLAGEAGQLQIPTAGSEAGGEAIPDRLAAHRGDVRTPFPKPVSIRRGPGEILPEAVSSGAEERVGPAPRSGTTELPGGAVIKRPPLGLLPENTASAPLPARPLNMPAVGQPAAAAPATELPRVSSMDRLQQLIQTEGAGTPPLQKNVPLGEQLFTPRKPVTEMPSVGQKVSDVINQNTETEAVRPLASGPQKGMKLRDITEPPAEPVTHRATVTHEGKTFGMEAANGKAMYEATKHDTALAKAVHDLRNNDVRQAFLNAGGDVNTVGMEGQRFKVGNTTSTERAQMFDYMLKKGLKPEEIIKLARQKP